MTNQEPDKYDWKKAEQDQEESINESFLSQLPNKKAFYPAFLYAALCSLFSVLYWQYPTLKNDLAGNRWEIFGEGKLYLLLTNLFVHGDIAHFLSNMLFFVPFGGFLTFYYGKRMFPWLALGLGILTEIVALYTYSPDQRLIGSSGVLYAMFGLWLALFYKVETHLSKPKRWLRLIGFGLIMLVPSTFSPEVSYRSHYIGLFIGIMGGLIFERYHKEELELKNVIYREKILEEKQRILH